MVKLGIAILALLLVATISAQQSAESLLQMNSGPARRVRLPEPEPEKGDWAAALDAARDAERVRFTGAGDKKLAQRKGVVQSLAQPDWEMEEAMRKRRAQYARMYGLIGLTVVAGGVGFYLRRRMLGALETDVD